MVEAAIVSPLLMLFLLAVFEYGWLLKDTASVRNATFDAAREASQAGAFFDADYAVLVTAHRSLSVMGGQVDRVIIYRTDQAGGAPPAACVSVGLSAGTTSGQRVAETGDNYRGAEGSCNVYSGELIRSLIAQDPTDARARFGDTSVTGDHTTSSLLDRWYPARARLQSKRSGLEYIGVYVEARYNPIVGVMPTPSILRSQSVIPIEPRQA